MRFRREQPVGKGSVVRNQQQPFGVLVEPSQALAAYLKKEEYVSCLTIPKGDDRVMRYLKGETLSFSEEECQGKKGWVLVCLDDFPLGWGKINNGTLKNKYYAGWRMV